MSVKLSTRQVGDVTVIDAVGRITLGEGASTFRDTIKDLAAKGNQKVLLNLGEVSYIDSSGIGVLVSTATNLKNESGSLKLVRLPEFIQRLFSMTKLENYFEVFSSEKDAVESFKD